jgi:hypothetical protein
MIDYVISRALAWMEHEPVVGLMMTLAAVVTFAGVYRKGGGPEPTLLPFVRRILDAAVAAILLMGLLWAFRAVLHDNATSFAAEHGRTSEANLHSVRTIWGGPHVQRELVVRHWKTVTTREEQFRDDPTLPPIFRDVTTEELVDHDSITSVRGHVEVVSNERRKGSGVYAGFEADLTLAYEIVSPPDATTRSELELPLSGQVLYEDLHVLVDGVDLGPALRVDADALRWELTMAPGERHTIDIAYATRGVEHVYYQIPEPREIRDFTLALHVVGLGVADLNYPEGCLTPTEIVGDDGGVTLRWQLDRALTTAGMGLALPTPTQPGATVAEVLARSPYALMLLVGAICLVLLVEIGSVALLDVALTCAGYSLQFVCMAAVADTAGSLVGALAIAVLPTIATLWWLWRRHPSRRPIFGLLAFFVVAHPLSVSFADALETFDAAVVAGLVLLLVVLTLRARMRPGAEATHPRTPTLEDLPVVTP